MAGPPPQPVTLTPTQRTLVERLPRRPTSPQGLVDRVRILLARADDPSITRTAARRRRGRLAVRTWRDRWCAAVPALGAAEAAGEDDTALSARITAVLADRPRPGAPPTFTPEQICGIIALACTPPADAARPVTHWTPTDLAAAAVQQGVAPAISPRSVGRFVKGGRPQTPSDPGLSAQSPGRRSGRL